MITIKRHIGILLIFVSLILTMAEVSSGEGLYRGPWWQAQDSGSKIAYVKGVLDGMDLGRTFTTWDLPDSNKPTLSCMLES